MELWIRSQDRDMLIKAFEVRLNWQNDKEIICNSYTSDCCDYDYRCLGTYASKERALEVLDEIENFIYTEVNIVNSPYEAADIEVKSKILCNMTKIFEMPNK